MSDLAPSTRAIIRLSMLEGIFNFVVPVLLGQTLLLPSPWAPSIVGFVLALVRNAVWVIALRRMLRPVDVWYRSSTRERTDTKLRRALESLHRTPGRFLMIYGTAWVSAVALTMIYIVFSDRGPFGVGPRFFLVGGLVIETIVFGAGVLAYTTSGSVLANLLAPVAVEAQKRGLDVERNGAPVRLRVAVLAICIAVTAPGWLGAIGYRTADVAAAHEAELLARAEVLSAQLRAEHGEPIARNSGQVRLTLLDDAHDLGESRAWAARANADPIARVEPGLDRALAAGRAGGRVVVAIAPISTTNATFFLIATAVFIAAVLLWAPISSFSFGNDLGLAIGRVTQAAFRVVDVGDLRAIEQLPVLADDEVGELTQHFNDLLQTLTTIARTAEGVAGGDLARNIDGQGDLPDAFRGMLDGLRALVSQVRETSLRLASAAAEIYSASQEQEAAATQQSAGITEVSGTMESLSSSAAHIAESAGNVLSDAERTRSTTDQMALRISELNTHASRIGDLLEVIRDVADRSDLLALNGSLEATRVGESGRGFGLVATEMRRLAERVTATVEDVRGLIGDIRASGSTTVMANEQGRKLAESTTEAARRITLVTQQQRTATEQVSASVREIADVISQAAAATTQTRVSAEELKQQADRLEELLRRFRVESDAA